MRNTKSIVNPIKRKTALSTSDLLELAGGLLVLLVIVMAVIKINIGINFPVPLLFSMLDLAVILVIAGLTPKIYVLIKHRKSNFKCLYTPKFDDHLFNSRIFKKESDDTVSIPLVGDDPINDESKFFIYAPYDFSDQLLKAKDHINAFLAKERCNYRIVDCYLDDDRVVYICQKKN